MNYLLVYAHPNPKSFCHAILTTVEEELRIAGHDVVLRDLYGMKFDPVLKPEDFVAMKNGAVSPDVKREQDYIKLADRIVYIYPLWWFSMPAILKGYIDRVHCVGFAYKFGKNGPEPLLKKEALIITTQGGSSEEYKKEKLYDVMKVTTDQAVFGFCGIKVITHKYFGAVPFVDEGARKAYLEETRKMLKEASF